MQSDESYAYILHLKQCDAAYLRGEAERLYDEVITEYGDVPFVTTRERELQRLLEQPEPTWNGEPLTEEARRQIEERLARRRTLGEVAEARLDDWFNLAIGKPAPEIAGVDVHGRPLKLSDHRGKVVVLVFWGSWCGPCMREVPREKALVERMAGRPFVMLGVNTDGDAETARDVMAAEGMIWPNWHDGEPGAGPIAQLYHVRGYPTAYVIDAEGTIRSKKALGESLDRLVEELVAEAEARPAAERIPQGKGVGVADEKVGCSTSTSPREITARVVVLAGHPKRIDVPPSSLSRTNRRKQLAIEAIHGRCAGGHHHAHEIVACPDWG